MQFENLIESMCRTAGIAPVVPDEDGGCHFFVDGFELSVVSLAESDKVLLYAPVTNLPADDDTRLLKILLHFNHLYAGGGGAVMAIDDNDRVVLQRYETVMPLTESEWIAMIENFLSVLTHWKPLLEAGSADETAVAPQSAQEPVSEDEPLSQSAQESVSEDEPLPQSSWIMI